MRKATSAVALLATIAVALAAHGPSAVQAAGKAHPGGREIHIMPVNPMVVPDETLDADVAVLEGMSDKDLKEQLLKVYSKQMDVRERAHFPRGSVEAMQKIASAKESEDQEKRAVDAVMNRFALTLGRMLHTYHLYATLKVELASPTLTPEQYKDKVARLEPLAESWAIDCRLLVAFLRKAAGGLRSKSATHGRLQGVLEFITELIGVYETQQTLFSMDLELTKMRFKADRAVNLNALKQDKAYREAENQLEATAAEYQRRSSQARISATSSLQDGILSTEYITLLPFTARK
ncbi:hypothetical protein Emed_007099 [Eimeria media]